MRDAPNLKAFQTGALYGFQKMDKEAIFQPTTASAPATSFATPASSADPAVPRRPSSTRRWRIRSSPSPKLSNTTPPARDLARPPTATTTAGGAQPPRRAPTQCRPLPANSSPDLLF